MGGSVLPCEVGGTPKIAGTVSWAARDLGGVPIGNHHFVLIQFADKAAADAFTAKYGKSIEVQEEDGTYFITLGGFKKGKGRLLFQSNDPDDVKSVREMLDPKEHTRWYKSDLDLETHEVSMPGKYSSSGEFIEALVDRSQNFAKNEEKDNVKYALANENCSAYVNTLMSSAGVDTATRTSAGEFEGVDWGEEDTLPPELFDPPKKKEKALPPGKSAPTPGP